MTSHKLPTHKYLNHAEFIQIIEKNYHVKFLPDSHVFIVSSLLSGKKVTSFPHSFSQNHTSQQLESIFNIGVSEAKKINSYFEYKGYNLPNSNLLQKYNLHQTVLGITNLIPLTTTDSLLANYNSRHRNKVLKCQKDNGEELSHYQTKDLKDFEYWYNLLIDQYKNKHRMICQPYPLLKDLFSLSCSKLWIQKYQGKIIGGVFILHDDVSYDYSWGAFDSKNSPKNAGALLLHQTMLEAIENKIPIYNLGASSLGDNDLRFFKSRWGGFEHPIHLICWNHTPKTIDLDSDYKLIRKLIPFIPVSIFKQLCKLAVPQLI